MDEDDNRPSTPKLKSGDVSRSSSPVVTQTTSYPVSVRQQMARIKQMPVVTQTTSYPVSVRLQMARIKQMEQPSPSGSTDGEETGPLTPGGVTPGGAVGMGTGRRKAPKVHRRNGLGETPLHVAAKKGELEMCEQLVAEGAEVNQSDNAGWTPLHMAAINNRVECANFLLRNGADPNVKSQFGDLPLHDAVHCNYVRLVWTLLRAGAEVDSRCLADNQENQKKEDQAERARQIYSLLTVTPLPSVCPESEEEEDSEEERKEKEGEERREKEKRKKKDKEEKKKTKESSTPRSSSDKYTPSPSVRTTVTTAATTVFESPHASSGVVGGGGGTSADAMHSPHLSPTAHHTTASMAAAQILKEMPEQTLTVATEMSERRGDDLPSASHSIPATTPISVIVEGAEEEEEEEGEITSDAGRESDEIGGVSVTVPSTSLLSIADDVGEPEDDDDDEGKLMIDEGEDSQQEEEESVADVAAAASPPPAALTAPTVLIQPPTPVVEKKMELMTLERNDEEEEEEIDSLTRDSDPIDEPEEDSSTMEPSSGRAYSEDPPSTSSTGTAKKRKKTGDKPGRKPREPGSSKRAASGIGAWAKNRRSAEPELSSSAAAAATAAMMGGDDPFEFHDSSPDSSRMSRGATMDRELSAPPVPKRQRLSRTQSPSPSVTGDMDMEEDEDDDRSKKVPPLRLVLPPKPSDDGDGGDDAMGSSSQSTPIPSLVRKPGRGRPAGGRKGGDDEGSAQRMTRSKVRQSGRGLDEGEGGGKRKRGRQSLAAVMEEEAAGEEAEGDYSMGATPLMGGGAVVGEGGEMIPTGEIDWMAAATSLATPQACLENAIYEVTTQSTLMARANLDVLVDKHIGNLYKADRDAPQWEPSDLQLDTFLTYNNQYTLRNRPPPPGGWPPMVSAREVAEAQAAAAGEDIKPSPAMLQQLQQKMKQEGAEQSTSSTSTAVEGGETKKNPFEEMNEKMRPMWEELEKERALEVLQMEEDRVTLRLQLERSVITRERTMHGQLKQLTFCKYLQLKETCNPHSLLDKPREPTIERDVTRFMAHLESRAEELWKRHRFRAGHVAGMQISKWRDEAQRLEIKRGLKRQCRAFPEIQPIRVPLPPIEDFSLALLAEGDAIGAAVQ